MSAITLVANLCFSLTAYVLTSTLIPLLAPTLVSAGLKGRDLLKGNATGGGGFPANKTSSSSKNPAVLRSPQPELLAPSDFMYGSLGSLFVASVADHMLHLDVWIRDLGLGSSPPPW